MKILEKSDFTDLIHYERERSERTNNPFSLIHIDLSKIKEGTNGACSKKAVEIISSSIRTIDRLGWIQKELIGVLLPDTSQHGAEVLAEKLRNKLKALLGDNTSPVDFVVSSYPETCECAEKNIHSKDDKTTTNSKSTLLKMEYPLNYQSSDIITIDQSLIFDLKKADIHYNWQLFVKRLVDIIGALFGIVILSPFMLIIAAAIKLTSKGPALFRQERLGYQGKKFTFLKFRSMYMNNDDKIHREYVEKLIQGNHKEVNMGATDRPYYKIKNDSRITPLGRILRKSSLDELPQLFNVLTGQMSLVGPRPPIPYELHNYQNWHKKRILNVKPGMTGLWQVRGRSRIAFDEMVRLDLHYAKNWSLGLDCKILLGTFKAVLSSKGAD